MTALWWTILISSVVFFISIMCFVFPRVLFRAGHKTALDYARGLRNYKEDDGRTIIYEPLKSHKKYVNQYLVSMRSNKKVFMCKIDNNIKYMEYDVIIFSSHNSVLNVINVKEKIEKRGYTKKLELPEKASYASINVNVANEVKVSSGVPFELSNRTKLLFAAVSFLLSALEIFAINVCLASIYSDIFFSTYIYSAYSIIYVSIFAFLVALLITFITLAYLRAKYNKGGAVMHYEL